MNVLLFYRSRSAISRAPGVVVRLLGRGETGVKELSASNDRVTTVIALQLHSTQDFFLPSEQTAGLADFVQCLPALINIARKGRRGAVYEIRPEVPKTHRFAVILVGMAVC